MTFERILGVYLATFGAGMTALSVSTNNPAMAELITPSVSVLGVGAALIGGSIIHETLGSTELEVTVEGNAVKLKKRL